MTKEVSRMWVQTYNHNNADRLVPSSLLKPMLDEIERLQLNHSNSKSNKTLLRSKMSDILRSNGWSQPVRACSDSHITITSIHNNVGLGFQLGNMARFYADVLKFQLMYNKKTIGCAIYILPTKSFAKKLGNNVANFERCTNELAIFQQIINVPTMVMGIQDVW